VSKAHRLLYHSALSLKVIEKRREARAATSCTRLDPLRYLFEVYSPVTCNPARAVTLPNIGVPQCMGVPHRLTAVPCTRRGTCSLTMNDLCSLIRLGPLPTRPHTLTPSYPPTLTLSHPHTLSSSPPHTFAPSRPHILTPSRVPVWVCCLHAQCFLFQRIHHRFQAKRGHHTLLPTPCTLHPTPNTLHPAPYSQHPAPCTLHPTPCTLHPTPCTLHPTLLPESRGQTLASTVVLCCKSLWLSLLQSSSGRVCRIHTRDG